jgi:hypothetical protein
MYASLLLFPVSGKSFKVLTEPTKLMFVPCGPVGPMLPVEPVGPVGPILFAFTSTQKES